jgi:hypothetical protein
VQWEVNGIPGGNAAIGTVSGSGLYTAPAFPPSSGSVTIQVVSTIDASAVAEASITMQSVMNVSPNHASVAIGSTIQFEINSNAPNPPSVQWSVNGVIGGSYEFGEITQNGAYTAPTTLPSSGITVSAVTISQPATSAAATITLYDPSVKEVHDQWLDGLADAAASYGCTSLAVQQEATETIQSAVDRFEETGEEGGCLALWPISTDTTALRYSFAWGGSVDGKDILYISDVGQMRIWNGTEVTNVTSDSTGTLANALNASVMHPQEGL